MTELHLRGDLQLTKSSDAGLLSNQGVFKAHDLYTLARVQPSWKSGPSATCSLLCFRKMDQGDSECVGQRGWRRFPGDDRQETTGQQGALYSGSSGGRGLTVEVPCLNVPTKACVEI